jgi:hypothetical protein
MANRRYRSTQSRYSEDQVSDSPIQGVDYLEREIMKRPGLSRFDYSQLEENYPVTTIAEDFMIKEQKRQEQRNLRDEIDYRKSLIEDRASQLELKKAARDLDMYESQINREDAMLEQMPVARQKLAELDVRDPDFINKAYDIQEQHPMAFESDQFQKYIFQPMLNRNSRLTGRKQEGVVTQEGLYKAMGEISKYNELISARSEGVGPSPEEERYLGYLQNQIDQFYAQRGMENPMGVTAPQTAGIAPAMAPSGGASFSSIEEAESAGLPAGTIVYINGRKARID